MWRAVLLLSEGTLVSTFMAPACRTASMTSSATISAVLDGQVGGVCVRARVHVLDYAHVHICTRWNVFGGRKSGQGLFVCFCVLCLEIVKVSNRPTSSLWCHSTHQPPRRSLVRL